MGVLAPWFGLRGLGVARTWPSVVLWPYFRVSSVTDNNQPCRGPKGEWRWQQAAATTKQQRKTTIKWESSVVFVRPGRVFVRLAQLNTPIDSIRRDEAIETTVVGVGRELEERRQLQDLGGPW